MSHSMGNELRYHVGYNVGTCIRQFVLDTATDDLKIAKGRVLALRAIGQEAFVFDHVTRQAVPEEALGNY